MIILYHMGFYKPYFQESKVWIQFYQNPSFGDKILTIQSLKIPCDPYKIHTQSSFHTLAWLSSSLLFFFSSSSSSSSSLLLPSGSLPFLETNLVLNHGFVKAMYGLPKTHFWVKFPYLQKGPSMFDYLYSKFQKMYFGP